MKENHVIAAVRTEISATNQAAAKHVQQFFHEVFNSPNFLEKLDKNWTAISNGRHLLIDKIEIDLGNVPEQEFNKNLKKKIIEELNKSVLAQKESATFHSNRLSPEDAREENDDLKTSNEIKRSVLENLNGSTNSQHQSTSAKAVENLITTVYLNKIWIAFLKTGSTQTASFKSFNSLKQLWDFTKEELVKKDENALEWFQKFSVKNPELHRFIELLPLSFLKQLLQEKPKYKSLVNALVLVEKEWGKKTNPIYFLDGLKKVKSKIWQAVINKSTTSVKSQITLVEQFLSSLKAEEKIVGLIKKQQAINKIELQKEEENTPQPLYINNAGMVLISAFLAPAFKELEFLKNGIIVSPDKALQFLQFAENGVFDYAPQTLALYKVLCGLSQNFAPESVSLLNKKEKTVANYMLGTVLEHWTALKGTSPAGLREGFLCRNGKLEQNGIDFSLRVENKAQDILLAQIPWGYGVIKHPWMTSIIYVNW